MGSATLKALAVTAVLVLTIASGAMASGRQESSSTPTDASAPAPTVVAGEDTPSPHSSLSTFAAIGLGVIGLLWVRRHTAEL